MESTNLEPERDDEIQIRRIDDLPCEPKNPITQDDECIDQNLEDQADAPQNEFVQDQVDQCINIKLIKSKIKMIQFKIKFLLPIQIYMDHATGGIRIIHLS